MNGFGIVTWPKFANAMKLIIEQSGTSHPPLSHLRRVPQVMPPARRQFAHARVDDQFAQFIAKQTALYEAQWKVRRELDRAERVNATLTESHRVMPASFLLGRNSHKQDRRLKTVAAVGNLIARLQQPRAQ